MASMATETIKKKVSASGDTMTGSLQFMYEALDPSSSASMNKDFIYWTDKNGDTYAILRSMKRSNGHMGIDLGARRVVNGAAVLNLLELEIDATGDRTVGISAPALWRNALGLGNTAGALPIANGGTGATSAAAARKSLGIAEFFTLTKGTTATFHLSDNSNILIVFLRRGNNFVGYLVTYWDITPAIICGQAIADVTFSKTNNSKTATITHTSETALAMAGVVIGGTVTVS